MNLLEAIGLRKAYGAVEALRGVDAAVAQGQILCVLGPSGGGKSTLVRLLHLLETPEQGAVLVDGRPIPSEAGALLRLRRRFALVQQRPGLLRMPAIDNVAFPLRARGQDRDDARREAARWLDRLGVGGRAAAGPHGLSGGEAQRVALARALVARPDFLLVDEATNQLDPRAVRHVEAVLRQEAERGCAVVLVTHNVAQARRVADAVLFLEDGRVAESGPATVLDAPASDALRSFLETGA